MMSKKFMLSDEKKQIGNVVLFRVKALINTKFFKKGELGGWIEKESNLSQNGNAWVSGNAQVYGNARVSGNAQVYDDARVSGNAWVYDDARVSGNAWVSGNAHVSGDARVYKQKLIGGYFYHTKQKSEKIETVDTYNDGYEILCREPKFGEEEKPLNRTVKVRVKDGTVLEGEIIND